MRCWIIIFGSPVLADGAPSGTLTRRVRAAYDFGRTLSDPIYLVTGGQRKGPRPEWQAMRDLLLSYGVPDDAIVAEKAGLDTLSQSRLCASVLRRESEDIWFSTSRYHQTRCRLVLRALGIEAQPVPMPPDRPDTPYPVLAIAWLHELIATPYDVALAAIGRMIG